MLPITRAATRDEIPVIDLKNFSFTRAEEGALITSIDRACRESGFFYIVNHGISPAMIGDMFTAARRFFALPQEKKDEVSLKKSKMLFRGYLPPAHMGEGSTMKPNIQEVFQVHAELPPDDPDVLAGLPLHGPNQWPSAMPELKPLMLEYQQLLYGVSQKLLGMMAVGLGLPRDAFSVFYRKPILHLRLLHYPPQPPDDSPEMIGSRDHTDSGAITLLTQDDTGGLEVRLKTGEWVAAPPVDGAYIVNMGEFMKKWTDGIYAATPHRVINRYGKDRYSVGFFANPDYHAAYKPIVVNPNPVEHPFKALVPNDQNLPYGEWVVGMFAKIYHNPNQPSAEQKIN